MSEFNLWAVIGMINKNNDDTISTKEIGKFLKTQKTESVFTKFLESINEDMEVGQFTDKAIGKLEEAEEGGLEITLDFTKKKYEKQYAEILKAESEEAERYNVEETESRREENFCRFGYKFKNREEFDKFYDKLAEEYSYECGLVIDRLQELELTEAPTAEFIRESGNFDIMLPLTPLADIDWSEYAEILRYCSFGENTFKNTSSEHLPEGYDPQTVFENGKSIGLGIDEAHDNGYTGKGVSYAIIDSMAEYQKDRFKEYTVPQHVSVDWIDNDMHGLAVSYIAQEIAPDADCYYYVAETAPCHDEQVLDNLKSILEKNKSLPDDQKIRFVSMSMPLYSENADEKLKEKAERVVLELEAQGVWVYYSGCSEDKNRGYLGKIDPMGDPDDFDNYQIENSHDGAAVLYVNSGNRTVPDPSGEDAYRHDSRASQSWSIPVIAGYYTLACQADPAMTKERFMALAEETAQVRQSTEPIAEPTKIPDSDSRICAGRTEETVEIKIIDINALLAKIEETKTATN